MLSHDLMGWLAAIVKLGHLPPGLLGEVAGMLRIGHLAPPFSGASVPHETAQNSVANPQFTTMDALARTLLH